ncbi:hypothetical protein KR032_006923 [Drosophila birchii]|nr:hypothetical protein KR032_006923 [Drosophila birchii]
MPDQDCSKFDDFLLYVGEFGVYQKLLVMVMILAAFLFAFTYCGHIFMILVPPNHWCRITQLETLPKEQQLELGIPKDKEGQFERCSRYDVAFELNKMNISKANESWPRMPCDKGWVYDKDQLPYDTIATERNWVCDDEVLGTYTSTIYFMGSVVGCICFGYISDHCGRVWSLFLANSCALIGGCLSALCKDFGLFSATRFLVGMAHDNCFSPIYILSMFGVSLFAFLIFSLTALENVGIKYRALIGNLALALGYPLSAAMVPWIPYFMGNWRHFALTMAVPVFLLMVMCFLIPESPSWLLSVGKVERGVKGLKKVAKINRKTLTDAEWLKMQMCFELENANQQSAKTKSFLDLFKSSRRAAIILLLNANWLVVCLLYDAHLRIITSLGYDPFISFSVASLFEIPGGIVPLLLVDRFGRKPLMISALLLCGAFSFLAGMLRMKLGIVVAAFFARFFVTVAYNVAQQWDVEILPTVVRGQGWGVINVMGHFGALLSPSVVYTAHYYYSLPMLIITLISVLGTATIICLPETKGTYLPQTLEEAEKRWTLSCRTH